MRTNLQKYEGQTITFNAFFHRFGYKRGDSLSILVEKVYHQGIMLTEHTWIAYSEEFKNLDINSGDLICFDATVTKYEKKDSVDYGLTDAHNFCILSEGGKKIGIDDIAHFTFTVKPEMSVWRRIKGDKKEFKHNADLQIQENVTIQPGDIIEIELIKIKENSMLEYAWKIERDGRWNKGAIYNPITYGQALVVYGFYQIYLPENIHFAIKDFFFKLKYSKVEGIELPYKHEMKYYVRPDKFKNRKFINYDGSGNKITDETIVEKRNTVFKELKENLETLPPNEILKILDDIYGTTNSVGPYLNDRSPNYHNFEFLVTKTFNVFTSSNPTDKGRFLDRIVPMF